MQLVSYNRSTTGFKIEKSLLNEKFPFLEEHVGYSMKVTTGNVGKNVTRVISNSFLKEFQVKNCALVTIFNTLPRIFGSKSFLLINQLRELESINCKISFKNPDTDFDDDEADKDVATENDEEVENVDNGKFCQQKVTPWMMDENDENLKDEQGLIVCCSLIDKPNNLGGITRTAEVFGASELIFDNLKVLNDKNYTSLAVTAMKWIKISEVKKEKLVDYLMKIKQENYTLIGLEQTSNSVEIQDYDFPKKVGFGFGKRKRRNSN